MRPDAPYFIILLCLMSDDFTRQGDVRSAQWIYRFCIFAAHFATVFVHKGGGGVLFHVRLKYEIAGTLNGTHTKQPTNRSKLKLLILTLKYKKFIDSNYLLIHNVLIGLIPIIGQSLSASKPVSLLHIVHFAIFYRLNHRRKMLYSTYQLTKIVRPRQK